jgi:hypothetical protein
MIYSGTVQLACCNYDMWCNLVPAHAVEAAPAAVPAPVPAPAPTP